MDVLMISPEIFSLVILPILIFVARVADVTMSTIRIIFVSKGVKLLAPLVGFFEVLIWVIAVGQVIYNVTNILNYVAYAGGFALGTYIGIWIEERISIGTVSVRIISRGGESDMGDSLKSEGYKITVVDAYGTSGPVKIIYTIVKRKKLGRLIETVKNINPKALYSFGDIRFATEEPAIPSSGRIVTKSNVRKRIKRLKYQRKSK